MTHHKSPYRKYTEHFADGYSKDITDEIPFEIPENWVWCRLGEITKIIQYGVSKSAKSEGLYRLLRITDIQYNKVIWENVPFTDIKEKDAENFILENGDFLFARTGATVGKSYLVQDLVEKSVFASYLIRISLLPNNNINYIKYFFNSEFYWQQISERSIGIGQPNVNGTSLKELFLPLPPLSEQRRIVEKIEGLLALVDDLETNKTDLQSYIKQAKSKVLEMAIRGELVPQDSNNEPASVLLERIKNEQKPSKSKSKTTEHNTHYEEELPFDIPKNWVWCRLGEVCDFIRNGITIKQSKEARGYPITRIETISKGNIDRNRMGYANILDISSFEKYILQQYDILLSHINSPMHIGKTAIYIPNDKEERIIHGMNLLCIRFKKGLNAIYLNYFFNSKIFKNAILPYIKNAVNQASINISSIEKIIIPLPPLTEQKRIVEKIEEIFSALVFIEENLI